MKRLLSLLLMGTICASVFAWDGSGTENDPWLIKSVDDLQTLVTNSATDNYSGKYFKVFGNINFNAGNNALDPISEFSGTFDGDGYTINGFVIDKSTTDYVGFFSKLTSTATVKNIKLGPDCKVTGKNCVGGIAGQNKGTVTECESMGIVSGADYLGGIAGNNGNGGGTISKCTNYAKMNGASYVGGIVGDNMAKGVIVYCTNNGEVIGTNNYVGGIAGNHSNPSTGYGNSGNIEGCTNNGKIIGLDYVGGIAGIRKDLNFGENSNTGDVEGHVYVGGIWGYCKWSNSVGDDNNKSDLNNSGNIKGFDLVGGIIGYCDVNLEKCKNSGNVISTGDTSESYDYDFLSGTGGVTGINRRNITDCENSGNIISNSRVGGISGRSGNDSSRANITNCLNKGDVQGTKNVGGIVGESVEKVVGCKNRGNITGSNQYIGGIGGRAGELKDCENYGVIKCTKNNSVSDLGGIVGGGSAEGCANYGAVEGYRNVGGIAGSGSATNCTNTAQVSAHMDLGGIVGVSGTDCSVIGCTNSGEVIGTGISSGSGGSSAIDVGGIVGLAWENSTIKDCTNKADVTIKVMGYDSGGIIGGAVNNKVITLTGNVVEQGTITGGGAIAGTLYGVTAENCSENYYYEGVIVIKGETTYKGDTPRGVAKYNGMSGLTDITESNGAVIKITAPSNPAITVTAKSYTRVYGDANPTFEYTTEGGALSGTPTITCEATVSSPVGSYDIVIASGSVTNGNVTYVKGTLTITKAPLSIKAGNYTKKQGEDNPTFTLTYDGFKNSETEAVLTKKPTVTCSATKTSPVGDYDVTVSGAEAQNYDISYTKGKLTVTAADAPDPTITVTAKSYSRVYGDANPTFEYTAEGGTLSGTPTITCEATKTSPVGTYDIVIAKGSVTNGNVTFVKGTLTITKAPLSIKAGNYTKKQGEDNPTFTLTYEGFKNSETEAVLTKKPTVTCSATKTSPVGDYDVTVSGAEAQNYDISYTKGKLTITAADAPDPAITVTAKSYTRVYGDANPTFEYTAEGGTLSGTPTITCEATKTSPVGTYDIVVSKGSVTNGNVTYVKGTLTITKAPLTIKAGNYTKKQGEDNPTFTLTYEGFKNSETEAVLTKKPTVTCSATKTSPVGDYEVTVSGAEATNYDISYANGKLTVTADDTPASQPDDQQDDNTGGTDPQPGDQQDDNAGGTDPQPGDQQDDNAGGTDPQEQEKEFTDNGATYTIEDGNTVAIDINTSVSGTYEIQATVTYEGKEYKVTGIVEAAFENQTGLTQITIPSTIEFIGEDAFAGCVNLKSIYIYATTPASLGVSAARTRAGGASSVFDGVDKESCVLYVPNGCVEKYRAAEGWRDFKNIVEMGSTGIWGIVSDGQAFDVYSLQGRKLRSQVNSTEGLPKGVYIVRGRKVTVTK